MQATKLDQRPVQETAAVDDSIAREEPRWSRRSRLAFLIVAALAAWALPLLIVYYWLVF